MVYSTFFGVMPLWLNPLPDMPSLGSCNLAANKDVVSKEWKMMGIQLSD